MRRLKKHQALVRAAVHERKAAKLIARAELERRWAKKLRDWGNDESGDVPYPSENL